MQYEDEREMCARTIYCTNIDKKVKWEWIVFKCVGSANFSMHSFSFLHVFLGLLYLEWKVETVDEGWALSVQQLDAGGASWCKGLLWIIVWRGKIWHTFAEIFSLPCYVLLQFDLVFAT